MKAAKLGLAGSRLIMAIIALAIGVGCVSGALIVRSSVMGTASNVVNAVITADVYILPEDATVADYLMGPRATMKTIDLQVGASVGAVPDAKAGLLVYVGPLVLMGKDGQPVDTGSAPSLGITADPNHAEDWQVVGALPENVTEIALDKATAERTGLGIGDTTTAIINGSINNNVTVVGIVNYGASLGGAVVVTLSPIVARLYFSGGGTFPYVAVRGVDNISTEDLVKEAQINIPEGSGIQALSGADARAAVIGKVGQSIAGLTAGLAIIGLIAALFAGYLLVSTYLSLRRRTSEDVRTLRVMGATDSQLRSGLYMQALWVGLIGAVAGIVVGFVLGYVYLVVVAGSGWKLSLGVPWLWLICTLILGVAAAVVCAWLGLNGPERLPDGIGAVPVVVGAILIAAGVGGAVIGAGAGKPWWYLAAGVCALLAGAAMTAPLWMSTLGNLLGMVLKPLTGLAGRVAQSNVVRRPRQAASVAAVFILTVAGATGALMVAESANAAVAPMQSKDVPADFIVTPQADNGIIPDAIVAQIRQIAGAKVTAFGLSPVTVALPGRDEPLDIPVMFAPTETFSSVVQTPVVMGSPSDFVGGLAVNQDFARQYDLHMGDTVDLIVLPGTSNQTRLSMQVSVMVQSQLFSTMVVPTVAITQAIPGNMRADVMPTTLLFIDATDPAAKDEIMTQVKEAVDPYYWVDVQTNQQFTSVADPRVSQMRTAGYVLFGLVLVAGFIAVVAGLGRSVASRRQEFEFLRKIGAASGQLRSMVTGEAILAGATGSLIGLIAGVGVGIAARNQLTGMAGAVSVPWLWLVILFVGSIVVAAVAAAIPASRTAK